MLQDKIVNRGSKDALVAGLTRLTKLDVLAVLGLKLLTGDSDLAAIAVVEDSRPINRACNNAAATDELHRLVFSVCSLQRVVTYENLAVPAVCDFNLRGVVQ